MACSFGCFCEISALRTRAVRIKSWRSQMRLCCLMQTVLFQGPQDSIAETGKMVLCFNSAFDPCSCSVSHV